MVPYVADEWDATKRKAYGDIFSPLVEKKRKVLGKKEIENLKLQSRALCYFPTNKIKNKMNAQVQKLKRQ